MSEESPRLADHEIEGFRWREVECCIICDEPVVHARGRWMHVGDLVREDERAKVTPLSGVCGVCGKAIHFGRSVPQPSDPLYWFHDDPDNTHDVKFATAPTNGASSREAVEAWLDEQLEATRIAWRDVLNNPDLTIDGLVDEFVDGAFDLVRDYALFAKRSRLETETSGAVRPRPDGVNQNPAGTQ